MSAGVIAAHYVESASGLLIADTFTRADSTTTMGSTETGAKVWTPESGTWGISSNRAYLAGSVASGRRTLVDTGLTQYAVECTAAVSGAGGILFRYGPAGKGWFFNFNTRQIYTINSSFFSKTLNQGTAASGTRYRVEVFSDGTTDVYQNDVLYVSYSEAYQLTATKVGLLADNSTVRFDDFRVYSL